MQPSRSRATRCLRATKGRGAHLGVSPLGVGVDKVGDHPHTNHALGLREVRLHCHLCAWLAQVDVDDELERHGHCSALGVDEPRLGDRVKTETISALPHTRLDMDASGL